MKILAKMIVDPRLREDDENGREDDLQQKRPLDTWPLGLSVHGHL